MSNILTGPVYMIAPYLGPALLPGSLVKDDVCRSAPEMRAAKSVALAELFYTGDHSPEAYEGVTKGQFLDTLVQNGVISDDIKGKLKGKVLLHLAYQRDKNPIFFFEFAKVKNSDGEVHYQVRRGEVGA